MKKVLCILVCFLFLPFIVNAIPRDYPVHIVDTKEECLQEVEINDFEALQNADKGNYIDCLELSCNPNTSRIEMNNLKPANEHIKCANGKEPIIRLNDNGLTEGSDPDIPMSGTTCSLTEGEEGYYPDKKYGIATFSYNCNLEDTTTTEKSPAPNDDHNEKNPSTGVETYYLVLSAMVVALGVSLYFVNKKDLFKKI